MRSMSHLNFTSITTKKREIITPETKTIKTPAMLLNCIFMLSSPVGFSFVEHSDRIFHQYVYRSSIKPTSRSFNIEKETIRWKKIFHCGLSCSGRLVLNFSMSKLTNKQKIAFVRDILIYHVTKYRSYETCFLAYILKDANSQRPERQAIHHCIRGVKRTNFFFKGYMLYRDDKHTAMINLLWECSQKDLWLVQNS